MHESSTYLLLILILGEPTPVFHQAHLYPDQAEGDKLQRGEEGREGVSEGGERERDGERKRERERERERERGAEPQSCLLALSRATTGIGYI